MKEVYIILLVFLRRLGVTAIISTAIPISVVATFNLMYFNELSLNIKSHLLKKGKGSPMFSVQLDETFGIANLSQLMACIWYVGKNAVEEDFIFLQTIPEANNRS